MLAAINEPSMLQKHPRSVPLHQHLQMCLLFLSPLEINEVCFLLWYADEWFSIGEFRF